jgi:hypothetical protein
MLLSIRTYQAGNKLIERIVTNKITAKIALFMIAAIRCGYLKLMIENKVRWL